MRPAGAIVVAVGLIAIGVTLAAVPALRNLDLRNWT